MESKDKITEKKCLEIFKLLELESGIYNLEIKNIPIWWMIRFRFYERLYDEITKKTKAIIPVSLYGLPTDINSIMEIAKKNNLKVIEDNAELEKTINKINKIIK